MFFFALLAIIRRNGAGAVLLDLGAPPGSNFWALAVAVAALAALVGSLAWLSGSGWLWLATALSPVYGVSLLPIGLPIHNQLRERGIYFQMAFTPWANVTAVQFGASHMSLMWRSSASPWVPEEVMNVPLPSALEGEVRELVPSLATRANVTTAGS